MKYLHEFCLDQQKMKLKKIKITTAWKLTAGWNPEWTKVKKDNDNF